MGDGYQVSPNLLQEASTGINGVLGQLKTLGIAEAADEGRGFDALALSGMQVGNSDLQTAFSSFCDKWSWGVRTMVKEGNQIASLLGLSAGTYNDMEQYAVGALKDAVNAVAGNPRASEQTVEGQSFGQILDSNKPDYSAASFQKAGQNIATTWQGAATDAQHTLGPAETD